MFVCQINLLYKGSVLLCPIPLYKTGEVPLSAANENRRGLRPKTRVDALYLKSRMCVMIGMVKLGRSSRNLKIALCNPFMTCLNIVSPLLESLAA